MPRCVDQIQVVNLTIQGFVMQCGGLRFDGYPTLFFDIHRVQYLGLHLTLCQATATLNQAVSECGFSMVNMGND